MTNRKALAERCLNRFLRFADLDCASHDVGAVGARIAGEPFNVGFSIRVDVRTVSRHEPRCRRLATRHVSGIRERLVRCAGG